MPRVGHFIGQLVNVSVSVQFIVKFLACEHDMSRALEIISNGGIKQAC